jgi:hypothetical protein
MNGMETKKSIALKKIPAKESNSISLLERHNKSVMGFKI